jgi:hypothetical protein
MTDPAELMPETNFTCYFTAGFCFFFRRGLLKQVFLLWRHSCKTGFLQMRLICFTFLLKAFQCPHCLPGWKFVPRSSRAPTLGSQPGNNRSRAGALAKGPWPLGQPAGIFRTVPTLPRFPPSTIFKRPPSQKVRATQARNRLYSTQ